MIKYLAGTIIAVMSLAGFTAPVPTEEPILRLGDYEKGVERLQRRLQKLKFSPGLVNGYYGPETQVAVWSFQKSQDLIAGNKVTKKTWRALANPQQLQPLVSAGRARRVEIDLSRQLLAVYRKGRPVLISHVSTGDGTHFCQYGHSSSTTTPAGDFQVISRAQRATPDLLTAMYETFSFQSHPLWPIPPASSVFPTTSAPPVLPVLPAPPVLPTPPASPASPALPASPILPDPLASPVPSPSPTQPVHPVATACVRVPAHIAERLFTLVLIGDPVHVRHKPPGLT